MKRNEVINRLIICGTNYSVKLGYLAVLSILTIGFAAVPVHASLDRGIIQGTVRDPQGAVVPGASVKVANDETGVTTSLKTNSAGVYLAPQLVPGTYTIRVQASGFQPLDITNVRVIAASTTTVDAALKIGTTTQTVQVSAEAALIQNTATNFNVATLTPQMINSLPMQGRDIQTLVQLMPGVTQSTGPSGSVFGFDSQFGGFPDPLHLVGSGIAANGGQGGANAWFLDGNLNASLTGSGNVVVNPSPDAVAEFSPIDNGLAAEWGGTSGAVINVVLKSGTNSFHGDLYEINRNSHFSATNPFARRDAQGNPLLKPRVNYNDFGGTLGGPVYIPHLYNGKDRTFFFFSFDVSLLHENINRILTVPLTAEKNGDFTGDPRFSPNCGTDPSVTNCIYDPYSTTGPDADGLFHRTVLPSLVISPSMFDPLAQFYLSSYPDPNFVDPLQQGDGCGITCNNYLGPVGSSQTTKNMSIKIDHSITPKEHFFGEWLYNPSFYTNFRYPWNGATAQTQTGVAGAQPYHTNNNIFSLGLTSTFTSTLVNEARVSFSRQSQIALPNPDSVADTANVMNRVQGLNFVLYPPFQVVPDVYVGDVGGFGPQQWQNGIQGSQAITFNDNVTKLLGKHTLKGGLMFRRDYLWNEAGWGFGIGFGGGLTNDPVTGLGGSGLAQFLLGAVDQGGGTGTYYAPWQTNDTWGMYLQDEYRIKKNLTVSFGLRYDIYRWFAERNNNLATFNFNGMNPDVPFLGRLDYMATSEHPGRSPFPAHMNDYGPRISFAWSPNDKTVLRGGYGIVYSNSIAAAFGNQLGSISGPGFAAYIGITNDYTYTTPAYVLSQGAPPGSENLPSLDTVKQTNEQFLATGPDIFLQGSKDPYVQQWSFQFERQLPGNMGVTVGYVGTHGLHLYGDVGRNPDHIPTATLQQLRYNLYNNYPVDPSIANLYGCDPVEGCPGNIALLPYPQYTSLFGLIAPDGYTRYNSLQVKLEKHYTHGLNLLIAYTFQRTIASANLGSLLGNTATPTTLNRTVGRTGQVSGAAGGGAADGFRSAGAENPDNRAQYTGLSPDDIPHILNLAVSYDLPMGHGKNFLGGNGVGSKLASGWKLTQNWNFQSGVPLLISSGACNGISCVPNLIGDPSAGRSSKSRAQQENQWFNPAAFEAPFGSDPALIQSLTDGTADYNALDAYWQFGNDFHRLASQRAPGFWNADLSLQKAFHFSEARSLEFRWDVFNVFNHQNLAIPNTQWCLPPNADGSTDVVHQFGCQFGKITDVQTDPRAMQFGLKFYF
jgi:hypothetical protein